MAAYVFESGGIPTCGKSAGAYWKIELEAQTVTSWPLTAPTFGSPTALESPFQFGGMEIAGPPDAGQQSVGAITFQAHNREMAGGIRVSDILAVDKSTTDIHIRISRKSTSGGAYVARFWGVIAWDSLEVIYGDFDDEDTWTYKFDVVDSITQLEQRTVSQWYSDELLHIDYDYKATALYIGFIGSNFIAAGRYQIASLVYHEIGALDGIDRKISLDDSTFRWFRIKELLQSFANYLGLGTDVNESTAGAYHSTLYGYNNGSGVSWTTLDNVYIPSGLFASGVYKQGGFFTELDSESVKHYSFFQFQSPLEVLKNLCTSLGLVASIRLNSSGARVLTLVEVGRSTASLSRSNDLWSKNAQLKPYARAINGVQVTVPSGSDVKRGNTSSKSVNVNCLFSSCNNVRVQEGHKYQSPLSILEIGEDTQTALFVSIDTPTGTRGVNPGDALTVAEMNSVCAIRPRVNGVGAGSSAYVEPHGSYQTGAYYGTPNEVMYPDPAQPYNAWVEVPGMAVAHLYWSDKMGSTDISVFRSRGKSLSLKGKPIADTVYYPGDIVSLTIAGVAADWTIVSYSEDWKTDTQKFELEIFA